MNCCRAVSSVVLLAFVSLSLPFRRAASQTPDSLCSYLRCALSIAPRLVALDVVRGDGEARVASLAFLWPRDVTRTFFSDSSAHEFAKRALRRRRLAAAMTDIGVFALTVGVIRFRAGGAPRAATAFVATGGALVAASVPIHFSADADLSRAVWRYNQRFSR
jgi:hypothetical protein